MTLWSGRFESNLDPAAWALNASLPIDLRLARQDVRGSLAWASMLIEAGILTPGEGAQIRKGLERIAAEFEDRKFEFMPHDEDIHSAVERRLVELVGSVGRKLHTGRSRNDQVATDFRMWVMDQVPFIAEEAKRLQQALLERAERDFGILLPGYTHLQRAQPLLLSHWWLSHFWPLQRDRERLLQVVVRTSALPLGSGALGGAPFPVDRKALSDLLGFSEVIPNSIDAVSNRDFAGDFLYSAALLGVHISRFAESMTIFCSSEFGFFELDDTYATGSSLMPQKKNPDVFELTRGKAGKLIGLLTGFLTMLKGLPSVYDKDLQEDKEAVFSAYDNLHQLLPVLTGAVRTLHVRAEKMEAAIEPMIMATDLADYLVEKGVPFREAHSTVAKLVRIAIEKDTPLNELPIEIFQHVDLTFDSDLYSVFDPRVSIARRSTFGGTAPKAVQEQINLAREILSKD